MSSSLFLVLIGPSGAGKSSLGKELREKFPQLKLSVSVTTRPPRPGEIDGKDYFFVTREKFELMKPDLLEWEEVHGQLYGTPLEPISLARSRGESFFFDIDIRGAGTLKSKFPKETTVIGILPPTFETLAQRIQARSEISPEELATRLNTARFEYEEMEKVDFIDYTVVNDCKSRALDELCRIVEGLLVRR
jgi:guanylate kinase